MADCRSPLDFDPWGRWDDEYLPKHPLVDEAALAGELRKVLWHGLPLTIRAAGEVLPNLRSVVARSIHPYDLSSRVDALNGLLVRMIVDVEDEASGRALGVLFCLAKGTRGLMARLVDVGLLGVLPSERGNTLKRHHKSSSALWSMAPQLLDELRKQ